jgi:hypothetical protein
LQIGTKDYDTIIAKIKGMKNYEEVPEDGYPNSLATLDKVYSVGYKRGTKYFHEMTKVQNNEHYILSLDKDRKLSFMFIED